MIYAVYNIPISFPFLSFSLFSSHGRFNSFRFFGKSPLSKKPPTSQGLQILGSSPNCGGWLYQLEAGGQTKKQVGSNKQNTKNKSPVPLFIKQTSFFQTESQLQQKKTQHLCFLTPTLCYVTFFFLIAASQSAFCLLHLLKGSSLECASLLLLESPVGPPFDRRGHYCELL